MPRRKCLYMQSQSGNSLRSRLCSLVDEYQKSYCEPLTLSYSLGVESLACRVSFSRVRGGGVSFGLKCGVFGRNRYVVFA